MNSYMKRMSSAVLLSSLVACSATDESESLSDAQQALNGEVSAQGFLKRKNVAPSDENARRQNTVAYYGTVGTSATGAGNSIANEIATLSAFRNKYHFDSPTAGVTAKYYNRGDLGLGREMHCIDITAEQQVACYVTNYAAGPAGSEFTFGFSPAIAFDNMDLQRPVATVAMVFRNQVSGANRIFFVVYDGAGNLVDNAPLDRHGLNFANGFAANGNTNPDPASFGTPGVNLNNHIPSNCLNCHGGAYSEGAKTVSGAQFLPFDLDQFDYRDVSGETREDQEGSFRALNQIVRKVASAAGGTSLVTQLDGWYGNASHLPTLSGSFDSSYVPPGWNNSNAERDVYRNVVRRSCRGCHVVSPISFDAASGFPAASVSNLLLSHSMPHALQTQRQFWQSGQPLALESYFNSIGETAAASTLHGAGPDRIVTLDPDLIDVTL